MIGRGVGRSYTAAALSALAEHVQQGQPPGVPPLELTGERTLPDVPAENYWFRRHLVVYRWVAERCRGLEVVDLACGEGYGTAAIAEHAASVVGVDANPEAHEHARLKYVRPGVRFVRELVETFSEPCDAVAFLQTIEHLDRPREVLANIRGLLRPGGVAYVSTPNVLTLAPAGSERSDNPWHVREYRADEFRALCGEAFGTVELHALYHARRLRAHELALKVGWDRVHRRLGITDAFYERLTPAISERDFRLRSEREGADLDRALDLLAALRP
jgi:2-polyprenyl-3-methyl-5-hydroxy-6-metoxy-1,4-benzoquinol methylase